MGWSTQRFAVDIVFRSQLEFYVAILNDPQNAVCSLALTEKEEQEDWAFGWLYVPEKNLDIYRTIINSRKPLKYI